MNGNRDLSPDDPELAFLAGGGAMGACMRAHDWSATSLGRPATWSQPLRTAIRLILNAGHPMYVWWGPDLLCFYNDAYSASIGPEMHPASLGQPAARVWSEIWPIIGPQIAQVMEGRGATWHENQLVPITRKGKLEDVYWTYSYSPIDDVAAPHGVGGVLVVCSETTATVIAARERADEVVRQREMFSQAPGFMIIMSGPEHRVEFVNEEHLRLFNSGSWVGRTIREAFPDINGQGFFELLDRVFETGEPYRANRVGVRFRAQGRTTEEVRCLDFIYAPMRDRHGQVSGVFCEGFDVTDQVAAEGELREADRRKDEFLATLAHELRNPLAPISNAATLLQHPSLQLDSVVRYGEMIQRQTRTMAVLLDDLLEVSRISTGKLKLRKQAVTVRSLVESGVEPVRPAIAAKNHRLTVTVEAGDSVVEVDPVRMSQVLMNLLTNACKYSDAHGSIELKALVDQDELRFEVADQGIGLAPDQLPKVFDLFSQVSQEGRGPGLGIGLAVAQAIVQLHGGTISAESDGLGMGARFCVAVPRGDIGRGRPPEVGPQQHAAAMAGGPRVLVADDNVDAADSLAAILSMRGYEVSVAYDGQEAARLAASVEPAACFLDIGMPGLNGCELAALLRQQGSRSVLIAITGWGTAEDRRMTQEAGFDLHLTKPIDPALAVRELAARLQVRLVRD